jgi:DNA gyrase subunit A
MAETQKKFPVTIEDEMRKSYLDYAMSVIIGRAIPDARDGLKPVHRRILYSMHEQKVTAGSSYKKSARIVGDVLGKYHPHGDIAVYDALVRMAQDFAHALPAGGRPGQLRLGGRRPCGRHALHRGAHVAPGLRAAGRHRQRDRRLRAQLRRVGARAAGTPEPRAQPAVNGSGGIAVGMATNIPPHNLGEIVDATIRLIKNPELSNDQLMEDDPETGRLGVKGPDFPTAGFIYGTRRHPSGLSHGPRPRGHARARHHRAHARARATAR